MTPWPSPPTNLTLADDEVHLWLHLLQANATQINAVFNLLSVDEQARANRFYFDKDRHRYVLARSGLRCILSRYLSVEPKLLKFRYSPTGKPFLGDRFANARLCFNLSHTQQVAIYAVARNREVGVDIEQIQPSRDWEGIATRFFTPQENEMLQQLAPDLRLQGFFNAWTRKEAVLKAIGQGLTIPLHQLTVSLAPGEPARLLQTDWNPAELNRWSIRDLEVGTDYAAAVVAAGQQWRIRQWQFEWNEIGI
jgi:4'-phosphopantetheinyl transferase